ncbi:MAG: hypothetical protein JEZ03_07660 [Bacteroidales bacterium]|nr:hypothetical protein [Bacteroidales bacterium]
MEFFKLIDVNTSEKQLHNTINKYNIERLCESMFIIEDHERKTKVGTAWGEFTLSREEIKGGVRFALLECPNAIAWTITFGYPPDRGKIVLHLTINRQQKALEFVKEIEEFMDEWEKGIRNLIL